MAMAMARPGTGSSGGPQQQQQHEGYRASTSQQRQAPLSTDLLIQRLEGAGDVQSVLQLLQQPRTAAAAEPVFVYTAALKALARLLASPPSAGAAGAGRGSKAHSQQELQERQVRAGGYEL